MATPAPRSSRREVARAARDESGVVAVEFALILPLILLVLFAIIDFGQVFNNLNDANHIAGMGARYAAVDNNPNASGTLQAYLRLQADTQAMKDNINVCISFPNGTSKVGDPVKVRVTSSYTLVPLVGGSSPNLALHAEATMRIERLPSKYFPTC